MMDLRGVVKLTCQNPELRTIAIPDGWCTVLKTARFGRPVYHRYSVPAFFRNRV